MNLALFAGIHLLRDAPAVLDGALAARLGMEVDALQTLVAEDATCFPEELVFRLSAEERSHLEGAPILAFTEGGVALLDPKLDRAKVMATLKDLAAAQGAWLEQARLAQRVEVLEAEFKALAELLKGTGAEPKSERPIGFVGENLPHGLKAKERDEREVEGKDRR